MIVAREIGTDKFLGTFRDLPQALRTFNAIRLRGKFRDKAPRIAVRQYDRGQYGETYTLCHMNGWRKEASRTKSICIIPAKKMNHLNGVSSTMNPSLISTENYRFIGIKQLLIVSLK